MEKMKVGFFNPYLGTAGGGGERYTMTLADYLSKQGHQVDVFWNNEKIKKDLRERFGLKLKKIRFVENIFSSRGGLYQKWQVTRKYDLIFFLSDGSLPFLFAKRNILHFQIPFQDVGGKTLLSRSKLKRFSDVVCNSQFTKKFIDQEYGVESKVIYPPVNVKDLKPGEKQNLILSVGRFTQAVHAKKQHLLVEVFKKMSETKLKGWQLILVGGTLKEDEKYINSIKKLIKDYPIRVETNISFSQLKDYYSKAKIFWHAAGFGEDEDRHPERMEHFGIVAVEAMAAGCVPVVIDRGGLPEIVTNKANGLLWETKSGLAKATQLLIASPSLWRKLSVQAIKDSQKFSEKVFCQKFDEIIQD